MQQSSLEFLYRLQKQTKIALGHAESRPGVTADELNNLCKKLSIVDWLIQAAWNVKDGGTE